MAQAQKEVAREFANRDGRDEHLNDARINGEELQANLATERARLARASPPGAGSAPALRRSGPALPSSASALDAERERLSRGADSARPRHAEPDEE